MPMKNTGSSGKNLSDIRRIIGSYKSDIKGPNVIVFGGIHGNEHAGIKALKTILKDLGRIKPQFKGNLFAFAGNTGAISANKRFLVRDLNRIWYPGFTINKDERDKVPEYSEKIDILKHILSLLQKYPSRSIFLIDLHTTSSQSIPFISISDTLKNRRITNNLPVPLVLGLEELLDGPMFSFFSELGLPTVLFEGGQHESASSIENHTAFIWLMLKELGCIKTRDIPDFHKYVEILKKNSLDEQRVFELKYRYLIGENESFEMNEGYTNFQHIKKGENIARNGKGKIVAPKNGRIFMPLYQKQGKDGFFIVRDIDPFWLKFSRRTRRWRVEHLLRLMPGVARENGRSNSFRVDKKIAFWRVLPVFHLLGYRKVTDKGHFITVTRRPYDSRFPRTSSVIKNIEAYLEKITS
jgi:hypothetical protein